MTYLAVAEALALAGLALMLYRLRGRLASSELESAGIRSEAARLRGDLALSLEREEGWRDQINRLEQVISARDERIRRQVEQLDRCQDPAAVGALLLDELRAPLPSTLPQPPRSLSKPTPKG